MAPSLTGASFIPALLPQERPDAIIATRWSESPLPKKDKQHTRFYAMDFCPTSRPTIKSF